MEWSWIEFWNSFSSSVFAGLAITAILGSFGFIFKKYVRGYIRQFFHIEVQLELNFQDSGPVMELPPTNGRYITTYFQLRIKNKSDVPVNLDHAYLHLIYEVGNPSVVIEPLPDNKNENGLKHFQIPLKGLVSKGSFNLRAFLQTNQTSFYLNGDTNIARTPRDLPIYYYFQTSTAYFPENLKFNEDEFAVTSTCKKMTIRLMSAPGN